MMEEIWKAIAGYEGKYQVSNLGRVRSIPRTEKDSMGRRHRTNGGIRKLTLSPSGYLVVNLWKDHKGSHKRVNRLVAEAFIPNPNNYDVVNHKDEDKINNHVYNLEWMTNADNLRYGTRTERAATSNQKDVIQMSAEGEVIAEYHSIKEASEKTGINKAGIAMNCRGERKKAGGFIWKFKE